MFAGPAEADESYFGRKRKNASPKRHKETSRGGLGGKAPILDIKGPQDQPDTRRSRPQGHWRHRAPVRPRHGRARRAGNKPRLYRYVFK